MASVRRDITENMLAALRGITVAGGYGNTVANVYEGLRALENESTPFLCLVGLPSEYPGGNDSSGQLIARFGRWMVVGVVATGTPGPGIDSLLSDVEKALMVDRHRGPATGGPKRAVDTKFRRLAIFEDEPQEPWNEFQLEVEVHFRTPIGDPTTPR